MNAATKGKSPFYPGQPVPVELFVGRDREIQRVTRALSQVALGKPQAVFVTGEYGIGKSSLAGFIRFLAEKQHSLFGIHTFLGGAESLEELATKTVEAVLRSGAFSSTWKDSARNFLGKYVGDQTLFGVNINLAQLRADSADLSRGFLPFLRHLHTHLAPQGAKGLLLILDEINGITSSPKFSHFIKALVDENALARPSLPLLLMLCGVDERRREMIKHHPPVERIFEIAEIKPMTEDEMRAFFEGAFGSQQITVDSDAMKLMMHYSAGYPKVMHIVGDAAFWIDDDSKISKDDALSAVVTAAEEIGHKFVDQQVFDALHSKDYRSILAKLAKKEFDLSFKRVEIVKGLTEIEKRKFDNFLQKMKKLNVLRAGVETGEYVFNSRLVRLYILFNSAKISKG